MTKNNAKDVDFLVKAAFDLPAPEMPAVFDQDVVELTENDMEYVVAAGTSDQSLIIHVGAESNNTGRKIVHECE